MSDSSQNQHRIHRENRYGVLPDEYLKFEDFSDRLRLSEDVEEALKAKLKATEIEGCHVINREAVYLFARVGIGCMAGLRAELSQKTKGKSVKRAKKKGNTNGT